MSAQHTPGRLIVRNGYSLYAADGKTPVADTCLTNSVPDNDEANARRLVACWNACEGISTDALERLGTPDRARVDLDVIRPQAIAQRDELLEALLTARDHIDMDALEISHCKDAERIRAAIAKATGDNK